MIISKDKSPGNDSLTKEFYETFWEVLETSYQVLTQHLTKANKVIQKHNQ